MMIKVMMVIINNNNNNDNNNNEGMPALMHEASQQKTLAFSTDVHIQGLARVLPRGLNYDLNFLTYLQ